MAAVAPSIVTLAQGSVQRATARLLQGMLQDIAAGVDEHLDLLPTLERLLCTELHICARFSIYGDFPFQLWTLV